jgi:ribulose-phosphate 3-epimerase
MLARPIVLPSILSCDFAHARRDIVDAIGHAQPGAVRPVIHIDVMDGHLVPNMSFGPPVIKKLRAALPDFFFDVHLMIDEPVRYAKAFRDAGADNITFHIEAGDVRADPLAAVDAVRATGASVGVTLKPATPLDSLDSILDRVDLVLVMSVEPGFGGQSFMADQLDKCRALRRSLRADQVLEIDGGINGQTIAQAQDAGVEWFVVGSALFDAGDRARVARQLNAALGCP